MAIDATTITPAASFSLTPTVTAAAYSSGQVIGGLLTLSGAARNSLGLGNTGGLVQSVTVTFASGVTPPVDVILFSANPTSSTVTDHTALAVVAADLGKVEAVFHLTDATSLGTTSVVQSQQQAVPFLLPAGTSTLYAAVVARAAATLTSTSDVTVALNILQN